MILNSGESVFISLADSTKALPIVNNRDPEEVIEISKFIIQQLGRLVNYYKVEIKPGADDIIEMASIILDEYHDFSMEDFVVFCKRCKIGHVVAGGFRGELGKVFNRLDAPMIFQWMQVYREAKAVQREVNYETEKRNEFLIERSQANPEDLIKLRELIELSKILKKEKIKVDYVPKNSGPETPLEFAKPYKRDTTEPLLRMLEQTIIESGIEVAINQIQVFEQTDPTNPALPKMKEFIQNYNQTETL